jgi:hypothetical protein
MRGDSNPETDTPAESVDPPAGDMPANLARQAWFAAQRPRWTVETSALDQALQEVIDDVALRQETHDEALHAWLWHRLVVGETAPANLRKKLLAEFTKGRRSQPIPERLSEEQDRVLRLAKEIIDDDARKAGRSTELRQGELALAFLLAREMLTQESREIPDDLDAVADESTEEIRGTAETTSDDRPEETMHQKLRRLQELIRQEEALKQD